jgi:hypothetical protein
MEDIQSRAIHRNHRLESLYLDPNRINNRFRTNYKIYNLISTADTQAIKHTKYRRKQ